MSGSSTLQRLASSWKFGGTLIIDVIPLLLAFGMWLALPHDLGSTLSFDSYRYLAGAVSLLEEGKYLDVSGGRQDIWAPGTSIVYALSSAVSGKPPETLTKFVDLAALLVSLCAATVFLRRTVRLPFRFAGMLTIALNTALLSAHNKLWSDPIALGALLCVLTTAMLAVLEPNRGRRLLFFGAASLAGSFAILVRFALLSVAVLLLIVAMMLWNRYRDRWPSLFAALTPVPAQLIGFLIQGQGTRTRNAVYGWPTLSDDFIAIGDLSQQLIPAPEPGGLALFGVAVFSLAIPGWALRSQLTSSSHRAALQVSLIWIAVYGTFLGIAQSVTQPSFTTDLRILLPVFPALIYCTVVASDALWTQRRADRKFLVLSLLMTTFLLAVIPRTIRSAYAAQNRWRHGEPVLCNIDLLASIMRDRISKHRFDEVISNGSGPTWMALRRPVLQLNTSTLQSASSDTLIVLIDPASPCASLIEEVGTEEALISGRLAVIERVQGLIVARTRHMGPPSS